MGHQCHLRSCLLGPQLQAQLSATLSQQSLSFGLSPFVPSWVPVHSGLFVLSFLQRLRMPRRGDHIHHFPFTLCGLATVTPSPCTCQMCIVRFEDYPHFFSIFIHDEIHHKVKQANKILPFLLSLVLLARTTFPVLYHITAVAEEIWEKKKKRAVFIIFFSKTASILSILFCHFEPYFFLTLLYTGRIVVLSHVSGDQVILPLCRTNQPEHIALLLYGLQFCCWLRDHTTEASLPTSPWLPLSLSTSGSFCAEDQE